MELRAQPTSLRRTHEVEPVSNEPETEAPDKQPEAADETSTDSAEAEVREQEAGESTAQEPIAGEAQKAEVSDETTAAKKQGGRKPKPGRGKKKGKSGEEEAPAQTVLLPEDDEPVKGAYHVALPTFEGPLDLLLHLIQQHELDIKDIPIAFVSEKYLEYIVMMQDLNIDLASEYLVMAATLAHIKSKMLLPKPPADQDDDEAEELDPRGELVRRLLEYQKYKHAAEKLGESPVLGRDVFVRGAPAPSIDGPAPLAQVSVFKLFDAFQRLLSKAKQTQEHLIDVDKISISERIIQLTDILRGRGPVPFIELFDENTTRPDLIVSFLAVLEMTRLRMMIVIQAGPLEPIQIELTLADEHDEILKQGLNSGDDPLAALARGDVEHLAESAKKPEPASTQEELFEPLEEIEASFTERVSFEEMGGDVPPPIVPQDSNSTQEDGSQESSSAEVPSEDEDRD